MGTIGYMNAYLFDGVNDTIQEKGWFTVSEETGRFLAIGTGALPNDNECDRVVDLQGQYVMPGMINAHTHMTMDAESLDSGFGANEVEATVYALDNLKKAIQSGVTYVRECGTRYDIDIRLAQMQAQGKLSDLPEIMPSGRAYSMTGGHGDFPEFSWLVDSEDEMRHAVRQGLKNGAQNIKLMATGGVMSKDDHMFQPQLSIAEMKVAVEEAHHRGKIVCAHAEGPKGIKNAIAAGVDSVEHCFYPDEEDLNNMLAQGTFVSPTLVAGAGILKIGEGTAFSYQADKTREIWTDLLQNVAKIYQAGIPLTLATDAGTSFNGVELTAMEFQLFVEKIHLTPFQALLTSYHSAQLMKIDQDYGSIETGKVADFLVLKGNPLEDVKVVQQVDKQVYKKGRRVF